MADILGISFNGKRDLYQAFGYHLNPTITEFYQYYKRHSIARAVIKRPAQDTWAGDLTIVETHDDQTTDFEKEFDRLQKRLKLKNKFTRFDKVISLGNYGILLFGFSDCRTSEDFKKPVDPDEDLKLLYLKPVSEKNALIYKYDQNPSSERYGLPLYYNLNIKGISGQDSSKTLQVHYSRVLHVSWELLEDENEGSPVLEPIYNNLQDIEKLAGGSAEMFWRGARPGFQGIVNDDYTISPAEEEKFKTQMDEYIHNLRRSLLIQGMELKELAPQVEDPTNHLKAQIQMISAETGIPQRILLGAEQGELASGQDANAWKILIQNRRTELVEQLIVRPFIDKLIEYNVLPKPQTEDYSVMWSDLFAPSEKERSETGKTRAAAIQQYLQNPIATEIIPPKVFIKYFLGLDKQQLEYVEEMTDDEILSELDEEARMQEPEGDD
ncbi:MAG: anti-CBASS protein Acb1 family protein [Petrotogales bacterium]